MSQWTFEMTTVNRCGSLYRRLDVDLKKSLVVDLFSASGGTEHHIRDSDPVVLAIQDGDIEAVKKHAASSPQNLLRENKNCWIPLHHAAFAGQPECLKTLLKAHPGCVDKRTLQEQTALLLAVSAQNLSCVKCLLESGADPDIGSKNKETPLYLACSLDNIDMVNLILAYGASVNQRCARGWTSLHEAVSRNNLEICEILVAAGAAMNPSNAYNVTPLMVAAQLGRLKALNYLMKKGADVNTQTCEGLTALYEASKNGHEDIVEVLLSRNADANKTANSGLLPLHVAAQYGHTETVRLLVPVTSRSRLRQSGVSPLHLAAEHNKPGVVSTLLEAGADVDATLSPARSARYPDGRTTALCLAAANGCTETVGILLNASAKTDLDPVSPLLLAVRRGNVDTTSLLLRRGMDVNAGMPSYPAAFPAVVALCGDNIPLLKCLLNNGCDALSCFSCPFGRGPHPEQSDVGPTSTLPSSDSGGPARQVAQFCQWISSSVMSQWAGPIVDLLLEYVAHVQLCSKLTQLLDSRREWDAVKIKTSSPRPLRHLCRVSIRRQMGPQRLPCLSSLPLPRRLIKYLTVMD
ncbi:ankyrin repeat and SOCS box protein 2-like [Stigmatopora nigra]